ncbi:MAG: protein translocase subunit SecE [Phenylobacterium sp.]|jgi:preprotein translocase subunit SecE|nr:protein translocase subunit SecE [Phenylobacterium sp.]
MARKPGFNPQAMKNRAAKTAAVMAPSSALAQTAPKKKTSLAQSITGLPKFFREVRAEARKITWTSRRETWITSVMVAIMVVLAALYFMVVDGVLHFAITQVLKFAAGAQ